MIHATLLTASFTALVVAASDDANPSAPLTLAHADSYEVGTLLPLAAPVPLKSGGVRDMQRLVTDGDLAHLASIVIGTLRTHGAHRLHIIAPGPAAEQATRIAEAVRAACVAEGIACVYVTRGSGRASSADRVRGGYAGWPEDAFTVVRDAAAVLLDVAGRGRAVAPTELEADLRASVEATRPRCALRKLDGGEREAEVEHVALGSVASDGRGSDGPIEPTTGPALAAIDPGSAHCALAIAHGTRPPLDLAYLRTYPVGREVALAKPRVRELPDGTTRTDTHRHSVTGADMDRVAEQVTRACLAHEVAHATIEWIDNVFGDGGVIPTARARDIARTQALAATIRARLGAAGIQVAEVSQAAARGRVVRRRGPRGAPREIEEAVREDFANWPAASTVHERDAGVYLLHHVTPDRAAERAAARGDVRPRRRRRTAEEVRGARETRTAERRAASGCTCASRRHVKGCALYVAVTYATTGAGQVCRACGLPRKGHVCAAKRVANQKEAKP